MTQMPIFNYFYNLIQKDYGKRVSQETFDKFVKYCEVGKEVNGVKPILNWINLYAFGLGVTSDEALNIRYERLKEDI